LSPGRQVEANPGAEATDALAIERGAPDNITVAIVRVCSRGSSTGGVLPLGESPLIIGGGVVVAVASSWL